MKFISFLTIALSCSVMASAQYTFNIEREYKHSVNLNGGTEARQGVFANGKFYINNYKAKQIEVWNQEGEQVEVIPIKGTSISITADQAGNVMIENGDVQWPAGASNTRNYRIFKGGVSSDTIDVEVTYDALRPSDDGLRSDYLGPIEGDVMSDEGGTLVTMMCHRPVVNVARIANGEPKENFSFWVDTAYISGNIVCNVGYGEKNLINNWKTFVGNGAAYSQVTCFKHGDEYYVSKNNVGLKAFTFDPASAGSHEVETLAYKGNLVCDVTTVYDPATSGPRQPVDAFKMSGDHVFTLDGRLCVLKHVCYNGTSAGCNAFAIADDETGRILGVWYGLENGDNVYAGEAAASWLTAVPVSDTQVEIYQYFPASGKNRAFIAKYIFTNDPSNQSKY